MLGCHEFCGYYEWTFHFFRREWGPAALADYWAEAIGRESQQHYAGAAMQAGLAGLYRTWVKTGEEEVCDWTFSLDEDKNVLRWDMRQCPSKGFLIRRDLNADEDYCDHCMGWTIPMLAKAGMEIIAHEHNHCGQCWAMVRQVDRPSQPLEVDGDIRHDPRWNQGYLDRWEGNERQPFDSGVCPGADSCDVLTAWFENDVQLIAVEDDIRLAERLRQAVSGAGVIVTDAVYAGGLPDEVLPRAVFVGERAEHLGLVAKRYGRTSPEHRPLLLHAYLPGRPFLDFVSHGLPRAVPILPLLIRRGLYTHRPGGSPPRPLEFVRFLAEGLGKSLTMIGRG